MTAPTVWLLGESCPDCDLPLTLLDDGTARPAPSVARAARRCAGGDRPAGVVAGDRDRQDGAGAADGHAAGP